MKGVVVVALLAGCAPASPAASETAWVELGEVAFEADGRTPQVHVPWADGQTGVVIEASSTPLRCFQLDELTDEQDHTYEQPTAVAAGGGLFVLPSRGGSLGTLRLRFGLRDCDALTRGGAEGGTIRLRALPLRERPSSGTIRLELVVTPSSEFTQFEALLEALNAELSSAGIRARWSSVSRLPGDAVSHATFSRGDPVALQALLAAGASAPTDAVIPVVLAGCLRLNEPVLRRTTEPQGYTPNIPGGAGPADGVFIQGALCGTPGPVLVNWSATALARVIAHELGHYLGLFHSVEADGTTDQLEDTSAANLMYFRPSVAGSTGLSARQGEVMRLHPSVRPASE
jgi:hypothetical protein